MAGFYNDDEPRSPWRVTVYVDDRASDVQQTLLADIFLGRLGDGTAANFAAAIGEVHAVRSARIELEHESARWAIGAEGYVRVNAGELVPSSETVACGIPGLDRPGQELRCDLMRVDDAPLASELAGRCGFSTTFDRAHHACLLERGAVGPDRRARVESKRNSLATPAWIGSRTDPPSSKHLVVPQPGGSA